MAVPGPFFFAFLFVGFFFCLPHPPLRPLLIVWILAGLYLGRDIAIYCHYAPLLTLLSWTAAGALPIKPGPLPPRAADAFMASLMHSPRPAAFVVSLCGYRARGACARGR